MEKGNIKQIQKECLDDITKREDMVKEISDKFLDQISGNIKEQRQFIYQAITYSSTVLGITFLIATNIDKKLIHDFIFFYISIVFLVSNIICGLIYLKKKIEYDNKLLAEGLEEWTTMFALLKKEKEALLSGHNENYKKARKEQIGLRKDKKKIQKDYTMDFLICSFSISIVLMLYSTVLYNPIINVLAFCISILDKFL